jgi:hypothetical protein
MAASREKTMIATRRLARATPIEGDLAGRMHGVDLAIMGIGA